MKQKKILKIEKLNVEFSKESTFLDLIFRKTKKTVKAVENLSLEIQEGEIIGLVGESGSGKSSLIKAIVGINNINNGKIFYQEEEIKYKKKNIKEFLSKQFQMVFQDPYSSLNPSMTVFNTLKEVIKFHHSKMNHNQIYDKVYIHLHSKNKPEIELIMNELNKKEEQNKLAEILFDLEKIDDKINAAHDCTCRLE